MLPVRQPMADRLWLLATCVYMVVMFADVTETNWWSLSQLSPQTVESGSGAICSNIRGLIPVQQRICRDNPDVVSSVAAGARLAVKECQHQFKNNRWNCSVSVRDPSVFGRVTLQGNRETAYVYAITSASVVHSVTRACSQGELLHCACDPSKAGRGRDRRGEFDWGGCSDNVQFSSQFARQFIDARERIGRDARALMNLHNNRAGRRAVRRHMTLQCKCHGVSGSCTVRTCWLALQDFRKVGQALRERYDGATEVMMSQEGNGLIVAHRYHKKPTRSDIIYLEQSPDYCIYDPRRGSLGIAGRECKRSSMRTDGCEIMCCGRGYDTVTVRRARKCECKFHWCCAVKCKVCERGVHVHTCKGDVPITGQLTMTTAVDERVALPST